MQRHARLLAASIVMLATLIAVSGDTRAQGTTVKKPEHAQPATAKPPAELSQTAPQAAAAAAMLGNKETSKWTATTLEAATAEANKKVLEGGKVTTVSGEVVDVSCYLQLGKRGEAHVPCGSKCITNGQPIGLLDADGNLYLVMAEEHHPRRDGQVELKSVFLPLLAKTVTLTGIMTEARGYKALFVQAAELGGAVKSPGEVEKK